MIGAASSMRLAPMEDAQTEVTTGVRDNIAAALHAVLKHTQLGDDDKEAIVIEITRLRSHYAKRVVRPVAEQAHALALLFYMRTGYIVDGVDVVQRDPLMDKQLPTLAALKDMDVRVPDISAGLKYLHEVFESLCQRDEDDDDGEEGTIKFSNERRRVIPQEMIMRDRETVKREVQAHTRCDVAPVSKKAKPTKPSQLLLSPLPSFTGCI